MADNNNPEPSGTWEGIISSLLFSLLVLAILLLIFGCFSWKFREVYYPRIYTARLTIDANGKTIRQVERPTLTTAEPLPPKNMFHRIVWPFTMWLGAEMRRNFSFRQQGDPEEFGIDGDMLQMFNKLMVAYLTLTLIPAIVVAVLNATSGGPASDPLFNLASSRPPQGSNRLWAHFVGVYFQSFALLALVWLGFRRYSYRRREWLRETATSSTVIVTGLSSNHVAQLVQSGAYGTCYRNPRITDIHKLVQKRTKALTQLESHATHSLFALRNDARWLHGPSGFGAAARKNAITCWHCRQPEPPQQLVDTSQFPAIQDVSTCKVPTVANPLTVPTHDSYKTQVQQHQQLYDRYTELTGQLVKRRQAVGEELGRNTGTGDEDSALVFGDTGIVTLPNVEDAQRLLYLSTNRTTGRKTDLTQNPALRDLTTTSGTITQPLHVYAAAEPQFLVWKNLTLTRRGRSLRKVLAIILFAVLLIIAFTPAVFAAMLTSLQGLGTVLGFLEGVLSWGGIPQGLVQSLLPAVLVMVFLGLLGTFVRSIGKLSGVFTLPDVEIFVLRYYFTLLLVNVVLGITIATTIFGTLNAIVNDPSVVGELLGRSLPEASGFFISYVILAAVSSPGELSRIGSLVSYWLKKRSAWTQRQLDDALDDVASDLPYADWGPSNAVTLSMASVYALQNPVILPPAIAFFVFACFVQWHQLVYVYPRVPSLGGMVWPVLAVQAIDGLILGQAVWIAYFFFRDKAGAGYGTIPLLVGTIMFRTWFRLLERQCRYYPTLVPLPAQGRPVAAESHTVAMTPPATPYQALGTPKKEKEFKDDVHTQSAASVATAIAPTLERATPRTFIDPALRSEMDALLAGYEGEMQVAE